MTILLIDNNDSFTHNLAHLLERTFSVRPAVVRYADATPEQCASAQLVVISPGPGHPDEYSRYAELLNPTVPTLGVCLGMQILNRLYGGTVERLDGCVHGKSEVITYRGAEYRVARYHSLYCSVVAEPFTVVGQNRNGIPMAIQHRSLPLAGFQFHPESFMTENPEFFLRDAYQNLQTHP